MIMVNFIQGCCGSRVPKCCDVPHSKELDCFIKLKFGYNYLR
jgi:hypothetical protein